ncbi:hypothetical protein LHL20_16395 [Alteromonas sp. McT4-15]|uniref:hypothetical protein n=1 Tax=Alteromonas sp. McT4-15 TaxID=2881256 RepID=UPI001CF8069C|nr:hypothetical protein [Alteromonas sp. McT4-15]MCB4437811.1 hypothetical protein [Alteromonas sp. McT4-15]
MSNSVASSINTTTKRVQSRSERKRRSTNAKSSDTPETPIVQAELANASNNAFANKKNIMWVLLSGAMALTFIIMLFLPNTGMGSGLIATYSAMLWCGFFGASLWRYRNASGWAGFAYGSVVGFVIQFISQLM